VEVHPPEHPIHTKKDFFLHIFTITIGLLIAIGLEQTVEYFHHRREVAETREALHKEREANLKAFADNTKRLRTQSVWLQNDLIVLRYLKQHPGTPEENLPGILVWGNNWVDADDAAWNTAQATGVTALMPQDEVTADAALYGRLRSISEINDECWKLVTKAMSYRTIDPDPGHLSTVEIDHEIGIVEDLVAAHYRRGVEMENLAEAIPDFKPAPSMQEMNSLMGSISPEERVKIAGARVITEERLAQGANH
jgi:hypothetical protein